MLSQNRTTVTDLHRAVQDTLAGNRLGQPVFVRYLLHNLDNPETIVPRLAQLTATVRDWLGQPLDRLYAIGAIERGQVSLTLQFRNGAAALVSIGGRPVTAVAHQPRGNGVDLLVLGNHGAIYHDSGSAELSDDAATVTDEGPPDSVIQAAIERALQSGKPEAVDVGTMP